MIIAEQEPHESRSFRQRKSQMSRPSFQRYDANDVAEMAQVYKKKTTSKDMTPKMAQVLNAAT